MSTAIELSRLEPAAFEHLVNALALKVLGAGATGFGPGPDAGRDGWFEGESPYPSARQRWKGIWYIQSKFHAPHLSKDPQKWLLEQIRKEVAAFVDPASDRKWPDNWIVATNIDPSGRASRGTFDQARQLVHKARPQLANRFHIWGGQKLCDYLDEYPSVARRFGHFLTPGHVISALLEQLSDERASVDEIIRYAVARGIEDQRQTRLEQAGSAEDRRPGIDALFVDLPFVEERCKSRGQCVEALASASARSHRLDDDEPSGDRWTAWRTRPIRAGVWFIRAGPGRGKSSIGQFFSQVQRAALILQPGGLAVHPDIIALAKRIQARAHSSGCWPSVPRVPLWVELKTYAAWYGEQKATEPRGVASFLCAILRRDAEAQITVKTLRRALGQRSWLIVFDGLDEVPSDVKDALAGEVVNFVREAAVTADVLSICTSRPQGYAGQFDALGGAVVDLVDLPPELALECATKVAIIDRPPADAKRAQALLQRAIQSPAVRELLTTPLQAHIMAVLVRNGQRPPERKWDLYHKFYEVIREREANRDLPDQTLRDLFQRDPGLIDTVHQRLGFALHTRAERARGADASLTKSEFKILVQAVVREARSAREVEPIVEALLRATTERLVLISTPDQGDRVRFDIRAIQEFFAAEFLYVDTQVSVLRERLELISGDSHWREVVQFVLGALAALKRATEWIVALDVLRALDVGGRDGIEEALARRLARGALHAALFFENGTAENSRKNRDQLKGILEPIAETTDEVVLKIMRQVSAPESRVWVRSWAFEQVRRLQPSESRGALRILVEHCRSMDAEVGEVMDLLDSIDASYVGDLLSRLHRDRQGDPELLRDREWELEAEARFLRRVDCISSAPEFVRALLWEASLGATRFARRRIYKVARTPRNVSRMSIHSILTRMFDTPQAVGVGGVQLDRRRLSTNAKELFEGANQGLLHWLKLLHEIGVHGGALRTQEALSLLGKTWAPVEPLPAELSRALPMPVDPQVTPETLAGVVGRLTDEQLAKQMREGVVEGIQLRVPSDARLVMFPDRVFDHPAVIIDVVQEYPDVGWLLWCITGTRGVFGRDSRRRGSRSRISEVRRAVADAVERDPFLVQTVHYSYAVAGLGALDEEQHRVLASVRAANIRWPLQFQDVPIWAPLRLDLQLPLDVGFLPLVASAHISVATAALHGRVTERDVLEEPTVDRWPSIADLQRVVSGRESNSDERAAAILLTGLHPDGGWSSIRAAWTDLLELARQGLPVATGVGLVLEKDGQWPESSARRMMSELIAASRPSDQTLRSHSEIEGIEAVVRTWRERSSAPLTNIGAMSQWLALPGT